MAMRPIGPAVARAAMAANTRLMTADELAQIPDDGMRYELLRGELRTLPPGGLEQGDRSSVFDGSLGSFVRARRLGRVFTNEPGFIVTTNPDTVRAPDIAFLRSELLKDGVPTGYFRGVPDLAVEVISPNGLYTEVDEKVAEWLEHGTRLVFVVNPRRKVVTVHRPGQPVTFLGIEDTLTADDIVPGWSLDVRDLFDRS
jgi:Uma2 family endonuclease